MSVDLAHHKILRAKVGKGGIKSRIDKENILTGNLTNTFLYFVN